jgi:hypothetical protein
MKFASHGATDAVVAWRKYMVSLAEVLGSNHSMRLQRRFLSRRCGAAHIKSINFAQFNGFGSRVSSVRASDAAADWGEGNKQ